MPLASRALIKSWKIIRSLRSLPFRGHPLARGPGAPASAYLGHDRPLLPVGARLPMPAPHRAGRGVDQSYGAIGALEVRLAQSPAEVRAAQRLRYRVFFEEMAARPSVTAKLRRRDEDAFDPLCQHLLVVDRARQVPSAERRWQRRSGKPAIVGTYRILRQAIAEANDGFYTQREYDIAPLVASKANLKFIELGRSCVLDKYRSTRAVEMLWHGLWTYIRENDVDVMIGCASFPGTDPEAHATALSFLHHTAQAPADWCVRAHDTHWVSMDRMPASTLDHKAAFKALPPLIKGYLRLGAYVGDGAVVDQQFGTTDVLVVLPVERIDPRYFARFGPPGEASSRIRPDAGGVTAYHSHFGTRPKLL